MDAARDEEQAYYQLKFDLAEARKHQGGLQLEDLAQDAKKSGKRPASDIDPRPWVPMQLDAVKTRRMTDEEWAKLVEEGRCFGCKEKGHLYANCEKRPKRKGKGKGRQPNTRPRARAADATPSIEEVPSEGEDEAKEAEAPPAYTKKNIMTAIKKLSMEEREDLLDTMALESDQDF
jgi:hypothetical protein